MQHAAQPAGERAGPAEGGDRGAAVGQRAAAAGARPHQAGLRGAATAAAGRPAGGGRHEGAATTGNAPTHAPPNTRRLMDRVCVRVRVCIRACACVRVRVCARPVSPDIDVRSLSVLSLEILPSPLPLDPDIRDRRAFIICLVHCCYFRQGDFPPDGSGSDCLAPVYVSEDPF